MQKKSGSRRNALNRSRTTDLMIIAAAIQAQIFQYPELMGYART